MWSVVCGLGVRIQVSGSEFRIQQKHALFCAYGGGKSLHVGHCCAREWQIPSRSTTDKSQRAKRFHVEAWLPAFRISMLKYIYMPQFIVKIHIHVPHGPGTNPNPGLINARTDFARRLYGRPEGRQSRKSTPLKVTVNLWWLRRIRATGH